MDQFLLHKTESITVYGRKNLHFSTYMYYAIQVVSVKLV